MSQFSGKQYRGAMRTRRLKKHAEAELRNATAKPRYCTGTRCVYVGSKHSVCKVK